MWILSAIDPTSQSITAPYVTDGYRPLQHYCMQTDRLSDSHLVPGHVLNTNKCRLIYLPLMFKHDM